VHIAHCFSIVEEQHHFDVDQAPRRPYDAAPTPFPGLTKSKIQKSIHFAAVLAPAPANEMIRLLVVPAPAS
jgi:hypothetical protein